MLIQQGVIAKIDERGIWVSTVRQSACGNCQQQTSCHQTSDWLKTSVQSQLVLVAPSTLQLQVGDSVEIAISEQKIWQGLLFLYILPLVALSVGAMVGQYYAQESGAVMGAILAFTMALMYVHHTQQQQDDNYLPIISKKLT